MNTVKKIALLTVFAASTVGSSQALPSTGNMLRIGGATVAAALIPAAQWYVSKLKKEAKRDNVRTNKTPMVVARGVQGVSAAALLGLGLEQGYKYFNPAQAPGGNIESSDF